mgnify:CR=1 FL=1
MYGLLHPTGVAWKQPNQRSPYMYHHNVIALDLAKRVIQISKVTPPGEILFNKAVSPNKAKEIIANTKPCIVGM